MTRKSVEELARLGIQVEAPTIEVIGTQSVDAVLANMDLAELARSEAFMAESLVIRLATTTDENATPFAVVTINDVNNRAVIPRGVPFRLRRLHVEVLARMRETRYTQPARNMGDPEAGNALIARHMQIYPFEVIEDKNPLGRAWLEAIYAEPTY